MRRNIRSSFLVAAAMLITLTSACANRTAQADKWEFAAVRVESFGPGIHASVVNGPHLNFDSIIGTVVSAGGFEGKRLHFSRAAAQPLEVGKVYVVKLYEYLEGFTQPGKNPPEWLIVGEPNKALEPTPGTVTPRASDPKSK